MLAKVLQPCHTSTLYRFSNADGKTWLLPSRHIRTALSLYQPSSRNGKLLKTWFPRLHWLQPVRQALHVQPMSYDLDEGLRGLLARIFDTDGLDFSIFCGTLCVHQKLTVQLSQGNRIKGYCKITDSRDIARLFDREADLLHQLAECGLTGIPRCLFHGEWKEGISLFVQSTIKTNRSTVPHAWSDKQADFLTRLTNATRICLPFEESDYYHTLCELQAHLDWLPDEEARITVASVLHAIMEMWKGREVDYAAYHADFTPWNMFVERGELFVFDWEYAQMSYPPGLDRYHFFTQSAQFEKHWEAEDFIAYIKSLNGNWINKEEYMLYLLEVIARFTMREGGHIGDSVAIRMKVWIDLLAYLNKIY